jgi:hypothetical protein
MTATGRWTLPVVAFIFAAAGICVAAGGDDRRTVVPRVPDLKIKTRETYDSARSPVQTFTVYFKGAWERREFSMEFPRTARPPRSVRNSTITRCDDQRIFELNDDARLYASSRRLVTSAAVAVTLPGERLAPVGGASGPKMSDVKITVNSVDTGERRRLGPLSARHVITTTTTDAGPGATMLSGESVEDGWYVDLPASGCRGGGIGEQSALIASGASDRVHMEFRGSGRRGFPIELTTTQRGDRGPQVTRRVTMVEFSAAILDESLFDVPKGYRPAVPHMWGGFDMTKPDTVSNRIGAYWEDVNTWARSHLGF